MKWLLCLAVTCLLYIASPAHAKIPLAFRLDDIQCGWQEEQSQAIINAFLKYNAPLTLGVITGPGDCFTNWLAPLLAANPGKLEIASHTATHVNLRNLTAAQLDAEVVATKTKLESLFPGTPIKLFIPPFNQWNFTVLQSLVAAGYTSISIQCSRGAISNFGAVTPLDYMCSTNMYPSIARPFLTKIDGLYQIPVGAATGDFFNLSLLAPQALLNAPAEQCRVSAGPCSILSQLAGNAARIAPHQFNFASVMMHPYDFVDTAQIASYFDLLLPAALQTYDIYTISDLLIATNATGTISATTSSTGSGAVSSTGTSATPSSTGSTITPSSTGSTIRSSSTGTTTTPSSTGSATSTGTQGTSTGRIIFPPSSSSTGSVESSTGPIIDTSAARPLLMVGSELAWQLFGLLIAVLFTSWMA